MKFELKSSNYVHFWTWKNQELSYPAYNYINSTTGAFYNYSFGIK